MLFNISLKRFVIKYQYGPILASVRRIGVEAYHSMKYILHKHHSYKYDRDPQSQQITSTIKQYEMY